MRVWLVGASVLVAVLGGCEERAPEALSLLGEPLRAPAIDEEREAALLSDLAAAAGAHESAPGDEMSAIWHGRRLAYLGRYREAIGVYSEALGRHPGAELRRHRGHRYITTRRLDLAIADLREAAALVEGVGDEVEPDGAPNAQNIPRSTTNSNIWYHLGLAYYLFGDFERALDAYQRGAEFAVVNDDMLVANTYWLCLTYLQLERDHEASIVLRAIGPEMDVIENHDYKRLLLMFRGDLSPTEVQDASESGIAGATVGYGIGAYYLLAGAEEEGLATLRDVVETTPWAAFGHIAAEAELARRR